jgi:hypothetical protein
LADDAARSFITSFVWTSMDEEVVWWHAAYERRRRIFLPNGGQE